MSKKDPKKREKYRLEVEMNTDVGNGGKVLMCVESKEYKREKKRITSV